MKAVIYARYSSHNQREESIEGQLRECHEFADKNGMIVVGEYCDRALSGKTDQRPEFQRLIKDSEKGHFEAVLMYTLDRFARNRYDSAIYKARLKKNGVKVFYAKQPLPDTPESIILESVMEGYAEYYSENLARNVKRGMRENAMKQIVMWKPCLGYKKGADGKLEIEPVGAEAVKTIFIMYANGSKQKDIATYLNERGFKTSRNCQFTQSTISQIIQNQTYVGTYTFGDYVEEGAVLPIIDKALFDKVQEKVKANAATRARGKAKERFLLTTKLFCGHCGKAMVGDSGTSKSGKAYSYYICKGRCGKKYERKNDIEKAVVEFTVTNVLTDDNIERIAEKVMELVQKDLQDTSYLVGLREALKECEKRIDNLMSAIEQGIVTPTTKSRLNKLEQEHMELDGRITAEEMKKPFLSKERIMYWLWSFKDGDINDIEYQQNIIDTLVNSVFVYDGDGGKKLVIAFNISGANTVTIKCSDIEVEGQLSSQYPNTPFIVKNTFCYVFWM